MSKRFGTMPADPELAAFGSAFGGLLLGVVTPDLARALFGRSVEAGFLGHTFWPLPALFAATTLVFVPQVSGFPLRVALSAFAASQLLSIGAIAQAVGVGVLGILTFHGLFACALLFAAWPHAGHRAKALSLLLFASAVAFKVWGMMETPPSVFGDVLRRALSIAAA